MSLLLIGLAIVILGGIAALAANRRADAASLIGAGGALIGCGVAFAGALRALLAGGIGIAAPSVGRAAGRISPSARRALRALPAAGAGPLRGRGGLRRGISARLARPKALGFSWFCYNLLIASMALVIVAADGVLFLVAWEVMALSSFFLVAFEHERREVREAAWTYLIASHLGTAFCRGVLPDPGRARGLVRLRPDRRRRPARGRACSSSSRSSASGRRPASCRCTSGCRRRTRPRRATSRR